MTLETKHCFSDKSDLYATARPTYPQSLFAFLARQCRELNRAWDCGTGSGQAAVSLANFYARVDATDVSREQIANAIACERVHYAVEPAEETSFPDGVFDLITVAQALHWFDLERFWPEVKRTLKPGGVFVAWTYTWFRISDSVDAVVKEKLHDDIREFWAPQNRIAWEGYRTIPFPFEEIAVPEIPLDLEWNLEELLAYIGTWLATRRYIEANGPELLDRLGSALRQVWGNPAKRKTVSMEFYVRAGRYGI